MQEEYPIIPGRGLVTKVAQELRHDYLKSKGFQIDEISKSHVELNDIQHNIESSIGTVEIPVGIVGPVLFCDNDQDELVYTCAGTLEGALVASMNRGAKAISLSGGFKADFIWQKMVRAPMFLFHSEMDATTFSEFVAKNYFSIKSKAESFSNHAELIELETFTDGNIVHVRFIYQTGDASGQNMTTTCTWHAVLFLIEIFQNQTSVEILDFVIEGNAASDKKISNYSFEKGRGIRVKAECYLSAVVLKNILRTTARKMLNAYHPSRKQAMKDGMHGYNINIANAIAAIYVATGQDLACIHESSAGILEIEEFEEGLKISLELTNLVIGTVGGGTHLPKQAQALELMGCKGPQKVERFAKLIAGFAMGLEISTFAAIVSGEFAKSHEKLGRNKPKNWVTKSDINSTFIEKMLLEKQKIVSVEISSTEGIENGILTYLSGRVSKKIIGFETLHILFENETEKNKILLKSKGTDEQVIKGLHALASSIDPNLSDLIAKYKSHLEYSNCHLKETVIYEALYNKKVQYIPRYFGSNHDLDRENHMVLLGYIDVNDTVLFNSENSVEGWTEDRINHALGTLVKFQNDIKDLSNQEISLFEPWKSVELYRKLIDLTIEIDENKDIRNQLIELGKAIDTWEEIHQNNQDFIQPIHNDFNTRNVCVLKNERNLMYDFELSVRSFPHRDLIEFLSFTLNEDFSEAELENYLAEFCLLKLVKEDEFQRFYSLFNYAACEFIVTRALFYEVAGIVVKYEFASRVLRVALRIESFTRKYKMSLS